MNTKEPVTNQFLPSLNTSWTPSKKELTQQGKEFALSIPEGERLAAYVQLKRFEMLLKATLPTLSPLALSESDEDETDRVLGADIGVSRRTSYGIGENINEMESELKKIVSEKKAEIDSAKAIAKKLLAQKKAQMVAPATGDTSEAATIKGGYVSPRITNK